MSAFDQLLAASFKGVPFLVPSDNETGGRKAVVHEYPGSSRRFVEDLGALQPTFKVKAIIHGENAIGDRRRLTEVLSAPGRGQLIHPAVGTRLCMAIDYSIEASDQEVGMFSYDITFVQSDDTISLNPDVFGVARISETALAARNAVNAASLSRYNPVRIADSARRLASRMSEAIRTVQGGLSGIVNPVADGISELSRTADGLVRQSIALVRTPLAITQAVSGLMDTARGVANLPSDLRNEWLNLTNFGSGKTSTGSKRIAIPRTTLKRRIEDDNFRVIDQSIRVHSLINASEALAFSSFTTSDDIRRASEQLFTAYRRVAVDLDDVTASSTLGDEILTPGNVTDPRGPAEENTAFQNGIEFDADLVAALETLRAETFLVIEQSLKNAWQVREFDFGSTDIMLSTYALYESIELIDTIADLNRSQSLSFMQLPVIGVAT
jgi:prophage DNA circulation protein